jgi:hypothetical protein
METKHLGDSILYCPLQAKDVSQLSQVLDGCLSDREDAIVQPGDADGVQLLVEEGVA